jgi:hypothetical protein
MRACSVFVGTIAVMVWCFAAQLARAEQTAVIFDMCGWEDYDVNCSAEVEGWCRAAKYEWPAVYSAQAGNVWEYRLTSIPGSQPAITLADWETAMLAADDADITSHGHIGYLCAEAYERYSHALQAINAYIDNVNYFSDQLGLFMKEYETHENPLPDTVWYIAYKGAGIEAHLSTVSNSALIVGNYCQSCSSAGCWDLDGGAFLCHSGSPSGTTGCNSLMAAMKVLGCGTGQSFEPWPTSGNAAAAASMTSSGNSQDQYCEHATCDNSTASFDGAFAFDGKVVFRTTWEKGSALFFVLGVDSWRDASRDWRDWDVLARVRPRGGPNVSQLYEVEAVPDKAIYQVVEVDAWGRPSFSEPFASGSRPEEYDLWSRFPTTVLSESAGERGQIREWIPAGSTGEATGLSVSGSFGSLGQPMGTRTEEAREDSSDCADIVVYTNAAYDSLLVPVQTHLSHYPTKKVRYFTGGSDLEDAQEVYEDVCQANYTYNKHTFTNRFPEAEPGPGPTLLIIGDSGGGFVVSHITFADSYDRCIGACHSDRDATDVAGSDGPRGIVHRIPANTIAEVTRACEAADDWNSGTHVDSERKVIETVYDGYPGDVITYVDDMAAEAGAVFADEGYLVTPLLATSDFESGDWEGKYDAFDSRLAEGAAIVWGFDPGVTTWTSWPGTFIANPDTSIHRTQQRLVALLAGCNTAAVYWTLPMGSTPLAELWQFFDPRFTQFAGIVGHLDGGWVHQHKKAQELYTAAWAEAPVGAPLDWIVWRAIQMADEQGLDWMADYFRSAATMGAYILARPGGDENTSVVVAEPDSLLFCPSACGVGVVDSTTIIITVRDGDGNPVEGVPADSISVQAVHSTGHTFGFPCAGGDGRLHATSPTDSNGQVFIPLDRAAGHDPAATLLVRIAPDTIPVAETTLEAKSPDITGNGIVGMSDLVIFTGEYNQSGSWLRSDFNYSGTVNLQDYVIMGQHYGHSCGSKRSEPIPPELAALLGLGEDTELPDRYALGQCSPNPFNPVTVVGYTVPSPGGAVNISVYDVAGRRVTTLVDAESGPGWFATTWDGTSSTGDHVSSGVYFCKMEAPGFSDTKKLTLLK